jgi:hypothetical protein
LVDRCSIRAHSFLDPTSRGHWLRLLRAKR